MTLRIALLTLPSVMSDAASLRFAAEVAPQLVLLGVSDPMRPAVGGALGQLRRHLARSGPRMLPYLALGFGVPGRRRAFRHTAAAAGARFTIVQDVNGPAMREALSDVRPDLIVTLHFDQILAPETIALAPLGGINLHPSLLPRHRGPMPAFWALADGGAEAGISLHRLAARIDAGELLAQRRVALPAGVSALAAARHLHIAGLPLLREVIAAIDAGHELHGTQPAQEPYCGFADTSTLRAAARNGVRLVRPGDLALLLGSTDDGLLRSTGG